GGTLLLADERGAIAIPERMRILLDEQQLGWDEAWARTGASLVARFGSPHSEPSRPYWTIAHLEREQPRLLEILYEINRRHLDAVEAAWPGDGGRRRRLSLIRETTPRRLRLGQLAIVACGRTTIAAPWDGPAGEILADFGALRGAALADDSTAVFARRFVVDSNPKLAALLEGKLGSAWRATLRVSPSSSRWRLGALGVDAAGAPLDPESLVDVRLGNFAPHERPLLSVLWLVREHLRLAAGGWTPPAPRTVVLARHDPTGGPGDERLFRLLRAVGDAINADERVRSALRVAVLPRCDAAAIQLLVAGADLANEPGTAGSGAAGARAL